MEMIQQETIEKWAAKYRQELLYPPATVVIATN